MAVKYPFPEFLTGCCEPERYRRWLNGRAVAHRARDMKRGNPQTTVEAYRMAIHAAVIASRGIDAYTGRPLRWDLIGTYENEASASGKRGYKQGFGEMSSVDHVGDGLGAPDFLICAWRINDAKSDLAYEEFVQLCRDVVTHHGGPQGQAHGAKV